MSELHIYIWEGDGISTGYHDDGTLVVLAETAEQARALAIDSAKALDAVPYGVERDEMGADHWSDGWGSAGIYGNWKSGKHNPAIEREPNRIVDLDVPRVVAWNGGGYD